MRERQCRHMGSANRHINITLPPPTAVSSAQFHPLSLMMGGFTVRQVRVRSSQVGVRRLPGAQLADIHRNPPALIKKYLPVSTAIVPVGINDVSADWDLRY